MRSESDPSTYGDAMTRSPIAHLSYANVTATLALFVALGGTSYALAIPRNSVGPAQLKTNSVGSSEIKRKAVKTADLDDRTIRVRDISLSARAALQGQTGPPGPTFFATISSAGIPVRGNATGSDSSGLGLRLISFSRSMADCVPTATLTSTPGGTNPVPPPTAHVAVEPASGGRVLVRTFTPAGVPEAYPFNLVVACP
jgi:hypothetical protein